MDLQTVEKEIGICLTLLETLHENNKRTAVCPSEYYEFNYRDGLEMYKKAFERLELLSKCWRELTG